LEFGIFAFVISFMKLLILSPDAYSVFHTSTSYIFGGIEIETGHHATGLTALGVQVAVATRDQGEPAHQKDGVWIYPIPELKGKGYWKKRNTLAGRIGYRLFGDRNPHKTLEELFAAINPDAGYIMGMSPEALRLARYCKANGKPFIFRVAHDKDLGDVQLEDGSMKRWAKVSADEAREVIATAAVVLAQTPLQATLLKGRFHRESEMMFPPIALDVPAEKPEKKFDVFWIGRTNSFKRPEQLAALAARLPHRQFCMVLNKVEEQEWKTIVDSLTPNVTVIESVPADAIENLFRQSKVFVSTSLHEGFPNTFLQAAKNSLPVVSMGSDPNGMLSVHGSGILAGDDPGALVDAVEALLSDESKYSRHALASRAYVETFNDKKKINRQFYELLFRVCGKTAETGT
jgi:glycosyltransferase involved in cell wall biosynthesis